MITMHTEFLLCHITSQTLERFSLGLLPSTFHWCCLRYHFGTPGSPPQLLRWSHRFLLGLSTRWTFSCSFLHALGLDLWTHLLFYMSDLGLFGFSRRFTLFLVAYSSPFRFWWYWLGAWSLLDFLFGDASCFFYSLLWSKQFWLFQFVQLRFLWSERKTQHTQI